MAQIIKHRRGSLEALSAVTSSLQKGEIVIASGSSNLTVTNGASIVFAVPENGQVQAVNRVLVGASAPNTFSSATYNGMLKGVPYYASGSSTLYLLGEGANEIPDLTGNISNFSSSVAVSINALSASIGGGSIGSAVAALNTFSASQLVKDTTLQAYTASVDTKFSTLATYTGSNDTTNTTQNTRLSRLEESTASLNAFSASENTKSETLRLYTASVDTKFANVQASTASLNTYTSSQDTKNLTLQTLTASMAAQVSRIQESTASLNLFTASAGLRLTNLETTSASVNTSISGLNSYTTSLKAAITASGVDIIVNGSTTIKGNLFVQGTQTVVDSTTINIADNILVLNAAGTSDGGIQVRDASGGSTTSGSLLWDVTNDYWKVGKLGSESQILTVGGMGVVSGSSQINITSTTGYTTYSSSVATSISSSNAAITLISQSLGGGTTGNRLSRLEESTASLNAFSASQLVKDTTLGSYTASVDTKFTTLQTLTASMAAQVARLQESTASLNAFSASENAKSETLRLYTSSLETKNSTLALYTASIDTKFTTLQSLTASNANRLTRLEESTASINLTTASLNISVTNLNAFSASENTKSETLRLYTASVDTKFSTLGTYTASIDNKFTAVQSQTASINGHIADINSYTSSNNTTNTAQNNRLSSIETFTSSFGTTFSTSVDSRLDTLEGTGTIQGVGTGNNVTFASLTTTNNVTIGGDLVVQGNTVTLNTATLVVEDKTIQLASGSTNAAQANGAGIEVMGASATFTYASTPNAWTANIPISASAFTGSFNLPAGGSSKRIAFRTATGNLDVVTAPTTNGDVLQWNGTDFVMSNTIDGGSF